MILFLRTHDTCLSQFYSSHLLTQFSLLLQSGHELSYLCVKLLGCWIRNVNVLRDMGKKQAIRQCLTNTRVTMLTSVWSEFTKLKVCDVCFRFCLLVAVDILSLIITLLRNRTAYIITVVIDFYEELLTHLSASHLLKQQYCDLREELYEQCVGMKTSSITLWLKVLQKDETTFEQRLQILQIISHLILIPRVRTCLMNYPFTAILHELVLSNKLLSVLQRDHVDYKRQTKLIREILSICYLTAAASEAAELG